MTKKLEDLFNLDDEKSKEEPVEESKETPDQIRSLDDSYKAVQQITSTLPQIKELEEVDDKDLDNLAEKAEKPTTI